MKRNFLILALCSLSLHLVAQQLPMRLWYDRPANLFEESLPIGNGRLGALVYGGADTNIIRLNDITFWSGKPVDLNVDADANRWILVIRKALFQENYRLADSLQHYVQGVNSQYYQPLGTIIINDLNIGEVSDYRRELNLDSAVCRDRYTRGAVTISRTYFASHPDNVIAITLKASKPGQLHCSVALTSLVDHYVKASDRQLTMTGNAAGDPRETIHFCSVLRVKNAGGQVIKSDSTLVIDGATSATLYFVNETSFNGFDKHPVTEGAPYIDNAMNAAWHLANYNYDNLLKRHVKDYQSIFSRLKLNLDGAQPNVDVTTDDMLRNYRNGQPTDKYLETLYFQYGRYMLISSSRTSGVPANLQGLWNEKKRAPWRGNYTININLEENYWPCDVANMPEMFAPLSSFCQNLAVTGAHSAKNYYGINHGWSCGHNSDIWAMSNPVGEKKESPTWSNWNMGGAWLMQNIYDHYLYTQDKDYLHTIAYPLMKGASDFMLNWLIPNPKNPKELITAPSTSPEAFYTNDQGYSGATIYGGTADLAIVRELLVNTMSAAKELNKDRKYRKLLHKTIDRLHPYSVGHMGDINEWYYDWDDQDFKHRHQSHLIGLYPGHQITLQETPKLANAAARSLEIKGDETTGWSTGWRMNLWARLHNGKEAYHIYQKLLSYVDPRPRQPKHGGTYPNLFDAHPPFQIDGNFGGTAGVCEMLMQSNNGVIELLPALPEQWPTGQISGLKARGGFEIGFTWKDGKVIRIELSNSKGGKVHLKYNGRGKTFKLKKGKTRVIE